MKKKFIGKAEQRLKDNIQKQEEQMFSDTHDILIKRFKPIDMPKHLVQNPLLPKDILPGKGSKTFQIELNKDWFDEAESIKEFHVVRKSKLPMYQRIVSWLTFGLYKPTSFSYEVKEVEHEK